MSVPRKSRPATRWATLALCGLALAAGVAGAAAAPAIGPTWSALYDFPVKDNYGADIVVDAAGNSYAFGLSIEDRSTPEPGIVVVKYNSAGQRQWSAGFKPVGSVSTDLTAVADGQGNLIAAASVYNEKGDSESLVVVKFESDGSTAWDIAHEAIGSVGGLAVDGAGNPYVAGSGDHLVDNSSDALVAKFAAADGDLVWEARSSGEANTSQTATDVAVDATGGVFFTGITVNGQSGLDMLTGKLDAGSGAEVWTSTFDGPDGGSDYGYAIAVTASGVVVAGSASDATDESSNFAVVKYNAADGNELWTSSYDGPATSNDYDEAVALAVDAAGDVFVTGSSAGTGSALSDYTTLKLNGATGAQLWASRYNGPGAEDAKDFVSEGPRDLVVDSTGNVYVTGDFITGNSRTDIGTIKYNSAGQQQWVHSYNGRNLSDNGAALGLDGAGNVYVVGSVFTRDADEQRSIVVLKYLPTGRGGPAPRIPKPTFTFSESAKDKLVCFREEGETFCDEATSSTFKVTSTATMQDVDITQFDADTTFALSVGGLELERTLGDDPRYTAGKTKATFVENIIDDNKRTRKALTITLSWPKGKLKVSVVSTAYFDGGILADEFLDQETGRITDSASATVSLGDFTQEFDVAVTGKVTTRPTRDEEFSLSTVTLTGKGTGI